MLDEGLGDEQESGEREESEFGEPEESGSEPGEPEESGPEESDPGQAEPGGRGGGSGTTVLLGVVSGVESEEGDFGATKPASLGSWSAGGRTGEFNYSYPMIGPDVPGMDGPELMLAYSSGGSDGGSSINRQSSWVGEGFSLGEMYVERSYVSCADDTTLGNAPAYSGDLCWFTDPLKSGTEPYWNARLVFGEHSGNLVRIGNTSQWRLERDDGTRIEFVTSPTGGYWVVTILDGTRYWFGLETIPGATSLQTDSVWRVPVAGNHSGEPGYSSAGFTSSFTSQPWRWNLDLVVNANDVSTVLFYAKETNQYAKAAVISSKVSYDRGGYLTHIQYGEKNGTQTLSSSPGSTSTLSPKSVIMIV